MTRSIDNYSNTPREEPHRSRESYVLFGVLVLITLAGAAYALAHLGKWEWNRPTQIIIGTTVGLLVLETLFFRKWLDKQVKPLTKPPLGPPGLSNPISPAPIEVPPKEKTQEEKLDSLLQDGFTCVPIWKRDRSLNPAQIVTLSRCLVDCCLIVNKKGEVTDIVQENTDRKNFLRNKIELACSGFQLFFQGKKSFSTSQELERAKAWLQKEGLPFTQRGHLTLEVLPL